MKTEDYIYLISVLGHLCRTHLVKHNIYKDNSGLVLEVEIKNCLLIIYFRDYENIMIQIGTSNRSRVIGIRNITIKKDTGALLKDMIELLYGDTFDGKISEIYDYIKDYARDNEAIDNFFNKKKNIDDLFDEN